MRVRLIVASAVVLTVLGSTTAYAAWSTSRPLGAATTVRSGSFGVTATWGTALTTTAMYPGDTRTGVVTVAPTAATTSRWVYTLGTPTVAGTLASALQVVVYPTATCSGTPLTLPWTSTTPLAATGSAQHCVAATLKADTAGTAQGATATVSVPVTGQNRSTN